MIGPRTIRVMEGSSNSNSYNGPRTVITEEGKDRVYTLPNGQRIPNGTSKNDRRRHGHIHGQYKE